MALNPYEMKLHEHRAIDANNSILRVPGGWVYNETFVPWNNEFQTEEAPFFAEEKILLHTTAAGLSG